MRSKAFKTRAKAPEGKRKTDSLDADDAALCDEVLPELVRIVNNPQTKWVAYDEKLDATLADWATQKPGERKPHRK